MAFRPGKYMLEAGINGHWRRADLLVNHARAEHESRRSADQERAVRFDVAKARGFELRVVMLEADSDEPVAAIGGGNAKPVVASPRFAFMAKPRPVKATK